MGPDAIEAIRGGLQGPSGMQWAWLIVCIASLLICVLVVHLLVLHVRRHHRLVQQQREFARKMSALGLSRAERTLLEAFAKRETPHRLLDVVDRIEVFERAVHRYLGLLRSSGRGSGAMQAAGSRIQALRQKLRFQEVPGVVYYSTRELQPRQSVRLTPLGDDRRQGVWAKVSATREDFLELVELEPVDEALRGRRVKAAFFSHGRAYSFDSSVVEMDAAGAWCLLDHSTDVRTAGMREFHRVTVNSPIVIRGAEESADVRREGTLRDLSAGGLAVMAPCYYESGQDLILHISPSQYVGEPGNGGPALEDRQLHGVVVSTHQVEQGRCLYHIEFRGVQADDGRYLFRLVNALELSGRRTEPEE